MPKPYPARYRANPNRKGKIMSSELIVHTGDAAFEQDVLKSDLPVLLDFWAAWCEYLQNDCPDFGRHCRRI